MNYKAPELTALTPAIKAIQTLGTKSVDEEHPDGSDWNDSIGAYMDWE